MAMNLTNRQKRRLRNKIFKLTDDDVTKELLTLDGVSGISIKTLCWFDNNGNHHHLNNIDGDDDEVYNRMDLYRNLLYIMCVGKG